jgi:cob(I)alamin adenosyltransferase
MAWPETICLEGFAHAHQYRGFGHNGQTTRRPETSARMKIYTKTGDAGETGLFGGPRVAKDHARIEAFGTVDELNSHLGIVRTLPAAAQFDPLLRRIQCELFDLGAQLATPGDSEERITMRHVEAIERAIDEYEGEVEPLKCFILPTGTPLAAELHVARTVCRRAERRVVTLASRLETTIPANAIEYLNRLGDLLFVLARLANARDGVADDPWHPA